MAKGEQPQTLVPAAPAGRAARQPTFVPQERREPGRPSYLTADVEEKMLTALRSGNSIADSARYAGLNPRTVHQWLARGRGLKADRPATPEYQRLARLVDESRATARVFVVGNLVARTRVDARAAEAWLRVHGGDEWRGDALQDEPRLQTVNIDARQDNRTLVVTLPPEQAERYVDQLLRQRAANMPVIPVSPLQEQEDDGPSLARERGLRDDG